jgi:hypothetical protein
MSVKTNVCYVHVVPLLYIDVSGEFKTKAIQLSTRQLREAGIQPDILVARCPQSLMPPGIETKNLDVYWCGWSQISSKRRCTNYLRSTASFPETGAQRNHRNRTFISIIKLTISLIGQKFVDNVVSPDQRKSISPLSGNMQSSKMRIWVSEKRSSMLVRNMRQR